MNLPAQLGCESPRPSPVARFKVGTVKVETNRCPRALIDGAVADLLDMALDRYVERLSPREVRRLPNLLVAAVEWLTPLMEKSQ